MLKNWSSHAAYQQFIICNLSCFYKVFPKKIIQLEIFRSFSLMLFQKETSITNWVKKLHASDLLSTCIGCTKNNVPSLGAH